MLCHMDEQVLHDTDCDSSSLFGRYTKSPLPSLVVFRQGQKFVPFPGDSLNDKTHRFAHSSGNEHGFNEAVLVHEIEMLDYFFTALSLTINFKIAFQGLPSRELFDGDEKASYKSKVKRHLESDATDRA